MALFAATRNRLGADCDCLTSNAKVKLQFCDSTHAKGQPTPDIASTVIPLSQAGSPANTRRAARSSTWVKVASASNRWRTWLSTHEARRVEVERARGRGCLTRSVKLAQLVRYCSSSAESRRLRQSISREHFGCTSGSVSRDNCTVGRTARSRNYSELPACR